MLIINRNVTQAFYVRTPDQDYKFVVDRVERLFAVITVSRLAHGGLEDSFEKVLRIGKMEPIFPQIKVRYNSPSGQNRGTFAIFAPRHIKIHRDDAVQTF